MISVLGTLLYSPRVLTGDPRAVDPLVSALKDEGAAVRSRAAGALGDLGERRAIEPLTYLASRDEEQYVRWAAAEALERIGARA
jgi:HEAT repeat protein